MNQRTLAQLGLVMLKQAVLDLIESEPKGLRNVDVAARLDIHSGARGRQQDYLSWSVLDALVHEGSIEKHGSKYFPSK